VILRFAERNGAFDDEGSASQNHLFIEPIGVSLPLYNQPPSSEENLGT
jgi:hypothetical protein